MAAVMQPFFRTYRVEVGYAAYYAQCRVVPGRRASHSGPDSPRYMDPGTPGTVRVLSVLRDAIDVTGRLDADTERAIRESCERQAGVRTSSVVIRSEQGELPIEELR
jgi:hypothetical protein